MDDNVYWDAILHNFELSSFVVTKFTEDYSTGRDLMVSNPKHIKDMINRHNKIYRNHAGPDKHCYTNNTKINHILAFHCLAFFS